MTEGKSESGAMTLLKVVGAIVGVVSGIVGLLFLLVPDLRPEGSPENQQASLSEPLLERNISRAEFLNRMEFRSEGWTENELAARGAFVETRATAVGYKGVPLMIKWELIDVSTGDTVGGDNTDGFMTPSNEGGVVQGFFVPLPRKEGMFYVRLQLVHEGEYSPVPLDVKKTERFPGLPSAQ